MFTPTALRLRSGNENNTESTTAEHSEPPPARSPYFWTRTNTNKSTMEHVSPTSSSPTSALPRSTIFWTRSANNPTIATSSNNPSTPTGSPNKPSDSACLFMPQSTTPTLYPFTVPRRRKSVDERAERLLVTYNNTMASSNHSNNNINNNNNNPIFSENEEKGGSESNYNKTGSQDEEDRNKDEDGDEWADWTIVGFPNNDFSLFQPTFFDSRSEEEYENEEDASAVDDDNSSDDVTIKERETLTPITPTTDTSSAASNTSMYSIRIIGGVEVTFGVRGVAVVDYIRLLLRVLLLISIIAALVIVGPGRVIEFAKTLSDVLEMGLECVGFVIGRGMARIGRGFERGYYMG